MDPNAALREIRALVRRQILLGETDIERLCELIGGLDSWLSKGGFPPQAWVHGANKHPDLTPAEQEAVDASYHYLFVTLPNEEANDNNKEEV